MARLSHMPCLDDSWIFNQTPVVTPQGDNPIGPIDCKISSVSIPSLTLPGALWLLKEKNAHLLVLERFKKKRLNGEHGGGRSLEKGG